MQPDRTAPATRGDLDDLKTELRTELRTELKALEERLTRSTAAELGRIANVIMEHTTSLIRAAGDHPKAIEERLDAHIADASVHRRPSRR